MIVLKYQFPVGGSGVFAAEIYEDAKILDAQLQYNRITVWFTVPKLNAGAMMNAKPRKFGFYVTAYEEVPDNAIYIKTFQFLDGNYVLHMFEIPNE